MARVAALGAFIVNPALGAVTLYQSADQALTGSVGQLFEAAGVEIEMKDAKDADVSQAIRALPLPWVFSCGVFIGGEQEVTGLSAAGELKNIEACGMGAATLPEAQRAPAEVVNISDQHAKIAQSLLEPPPTFEAQTRAYLELPRVGYPAGAPMHSELAIPMGYPTITVTYYTAPVVDYGMLAQNFGATPVTHAPFVPLQAASPTHFSSETQGYAPYMPGSLPAVDYRAFE